MGDPVLLDEGEVVLGVEVLHRDDGRADALGGEAEPQRGGVVEGRRRQVHLGVVEAEQQLQEAGHRAGVLVQQRAGKLAHHALGQSGRARRVQHVEARHPLLVEWFG